MTFEEQVIDALRDASREWGCTIYTAGDFARWLAPRVVRAIHAAAWDERDAPWEVSHVRCAAALTALRGTSGKTPQ